MKLNNKPMLNAYPDSMGGTLKDIVDFLAVPQVKGAFGSFYILPSLYNTDLDRGFSVIDYSFNELLASQADLDKLQSMDIDLKLDFILNHASVLSPQFQDILKNGQASRYKDFFIDWNRFWEGHGTMTEEGFIQPDEELIRNMFFRKPGLPILGVRCADGSYVVYWNTFYQEQQWPRFDAQDWMHRIDGLQYSSAVLLAQIVNDALDAGTAPKDIDLGRFADLRSTVVEQLEIGCKYLGQMDLNINSPLVWEFYEDTLKKISSYGAAIVRLDAFAYAPKTVGLKNFMNEPDTWDLLAKVDALAKKYGLELLPEIHDTYATGIYQIIADKGYMTYDFFLPGLILDAIENHEGATLLGWANELISKGIRTVNMLGCHDGIPLLDLRGLLPEERIQALIDTTVARGGYVKDLHGQKNMYYQVNATYFSALGDDEQKMLLARALHLFMPGKPQVWYLDLFAGKNDHEAVARAGAGGHKEINRTNLTTAMMQEGLQKAVVQKQLEMLKFRADFEAFGFDSDFTCSNDGDKVFFQWKRNGCTATLNADLTTYAYEIKGIAADGSVAYEIKG